MLVALSCDTENFSVFKVPPSNTILEKFKGGPKFQAPPSMTSIKIPSSTTRIKNQQEQAKKYIENIIKNYNTGKNVDKQTTILGVLKNIAHFSSKGYSYIRNKNPNGYNYQEGNILTFPSFFDCRDKWPGCLPDPLYQGTCGSCWSFAIATCLSSRFYIESCGYGGCNNYPQMNLEALDLTLENINQVYRFRKVFLSGMNKHIDTNDDGMVTEKEWITAVKNAHKKVLTQKGYEKFYSMQFLLYALDYQSMGSIHFTVNNPNIDAVIERAKQVYKLFNPEGAKKGNIKKFEDKWLFQPIPLSADKIVSCCYPNCYDTNSSLFNLTPSEVVTKTTPQCVGGTLTDGWKIVRDIGTTTSLCIGYNLDAWQEGDPTPNCHELQGPNYNYCSGYIVDPTFWKKGGEQLLNEAELKGVNPISPDVPHYDTQPWSNPQLFRFHARNAYEVNNDMITIQREIIERGPVTSGFAIYEDFQYEFGSNGMGGQRFKKGNNPVGGSADSLIYMWDGKGKQIGGHAITIVGWGTYRDKDYVIPYWIILNSWGRMWGTNGYAKYEDRNGLPSEMTKGGYFWMVRGINNCGIEKNVVAGQPHLENVSYPGVTEQYGWGLPFPSLDSVKLIPPFKNNKLSVGDLKIDIGPFNEGGGTYNLNMGDNAWSVKGMDPPSPFVFFWPTERPSFCIGKLSKPLSEEDKELWVENSNDIEEVRSIMNKPIVFINKEQIQIVGTVEHLIKTLDHGIPAVNTSKMFSVSKPTNIVYKIHRGLDNTTIQSHKINSKICTFPLHNLSLNDLKKYPKCPSVFSK